MSKLSATTPKGHKVIIVSVNYDPRGDTTKQSLKALLGGVVIATLDAGLYNGNAIEKLLADADKTIEAANLHE